MNTHKLSKIDAIDGLRGLAILGVIYHHTFSSTVYASVSFPNFLRGGWLGVNLFFILSGFVLYRPYLLGDKKMENWQEVGTFYKARFFRLYPLFAFNVFASLFIPTQVTNEMYKSAFLALSTLSAYDPTPAFFPLINWVLWSLVVEIWFSLLFPLILLGIKKWGIYANLVFFLTFSLIFKYIGVFYFPEMEMMKHSWFCRIDDFFVGIFLCHMYYQKNQNVTKYAIGKLILGIFLILGAMTAFDLIRRQQLSNSVSPLLYTLLQLGFSLLILAALHPHNLWNAFCSLRPLRLIGMMCFSLYVWHGIFIEKLIPKETFQNYTVYFVFIFIFSALTYRFVEFGHKRNTLALFLLDKENMT